MKTHLKTLGLVLSLLCALAAPASAALDVKVGVFNKSTGAATASQPVTGVGFQPKAVILFTLSKTTANSFSADYFGAIGFTTGAAESGSVAFSGQDAVATSNSGQRRAAKALTIISYDGSTVIAECDLTSLDSDGFTLSWTVNDANAYKIGYIALGGTTITNAKVMAVTLGTGTTGYTGAGFQPDLVLAINNVTTGAPPANSLFADANFGAAVNGHGHGAVTFRAADNITTQQNRSALSQISTFAGTNSNVATYFQQTIVRNFDSDGFTGTTLENTGVRSYVLLIKGGHWRVALHQKPTGAAPAVQDVNVGIVPKLLIMGAISSAQLSPSLINFGYFGFGASDGTNAASMTLTENDTGATIAAKGIFRDSKLFVKAANSTGTEEAVADIPSFADPISTITWSTNDSVAMEEFVIIGGEAFIEGGGGGEHAVPFIGGM